MKTHLIGLTTCLSLLLPAAALAQDKQICEAKLFGKKARLWVEDGQPVRYQWSNRSALSASMRGNQITIAASPPATLSSVRMGQNAKGQPTITGDWTFKSNTQGNVVFTCRPK